MHRHTDTIVLQHILNKENNKNNSFFLCVNTVRLQLTVRVKHMNQPCSVCRLSNTTQITGHTETRQRTESNNIF